MHEYNTNYTARICMKDVSSYPSLLFPLFGPIQMFHSFCLAIDQSSQMQRTLKSLKWRVRRGKNSHFLFNSKPGIHLTLIGLSIQVSNVLQEVV